MKDGEIIFTGSQFRQYVHISTRKMKYLMDHNIVPHNDTGQATHRYEIKKSDADEYLQKVESDPRFLSECTGIFSSRYAHPKRIGYIDDTFVHIATDYFKQLWRGQPAIMTAQSAAELIGTNRQYIRRASESGKLKTCIIKGTITFSKQEFITFICGKERLVHPPTMWLKDTIERITHA